MMEYRAILQLVPHSKVDYYISIVYNCSSHSGWGLVNRFKPELALLGVGHPDTSVKTMWSYSPEDAQLLLDFFSIAKHPSCHCISTFFEYSVVLVLRPFLPLIVEVSANMLTRTFLKHSKALGWRYPDWESGMELDGTLVSWSRSGREARSSSLCAAELDTAFFMWVLGAPFRTATHFNQFKASKMKCTTSCPESMLMGCFA
jgi:hypothetical protein